MNPNQTVAEWMQEFYREKMFLDDAETAHWVFIRLGPVKIPFPNLPQRREAIWFHDLNHLLTGYDTTWTGEGEIAGFELASGFPSRFWIGYLYAPLTFAVGLLVAPLKTLRGFRDGIGKKNIYQLQMERAALERMKVSDLKKQLGYSL